MWYFWQAGVLMAISIEFKVTKNIHNILICVCLYVLPRGIDNETDKPGKWQTDETYFRTDNVDKKYEFRADVNIVHCKTQYSPLAKYFYDELRMESGIMRKKFHEWNELLLWERIRRKYYSAFDPKIWRIFAKVEHVWLFFIKRCSTYNRTASAVLYYDDLIVQAKCLSINFRGPNFELMASAYLSLDDTNDNIRTHDLKIENTGLYILYDCQLSRFYF